MKSSSFPTLIFLIAIHAIALGSDADTPAKPDGTPQPSKAISVLRNPPPRYPQNLKQKGISGKVVIEATVDTTGKVSNAKILESSDPAFSEAVLKAIRQWMFNPATKDGQPISSKIQVPFSFKTMKPVPEKSASGD
jgi:protein TonB